MRQGSAPDLSVVIPAWNERENLEVLLPRLTEMVESLGVTAEVVVVDGGSSDGTMEVASRLGALAIRQEERGYGGALISGFAAARAPFVITMDADLSHPPEFIREFWKRRNDAEMLIASRYVPGGAADMSASRRVLSHILNRTFGLLLSLPFEDLSSGFRQYRRSMVEALQPEARDFDVLEEILIQVYVSGGRIQEVPFHYRPRGTGTSHARLIKFGWAYLHTLARMRKLRFRPDVQKKLAPD